MQLPFQLPSCSLQQAPHKRSSRLLTINESSRLVTSRNHTHFILSCMSAWAGEAHSASAISYSHQQTHQPGGTRQALRKHAGQIHHHAAWRDATAPAAPARVDTCRQVTSTHPAHTHVRPFVTTSTVPPRTRTRGSPPTHPSPSTVHHATHHPPNPAPRPFPPSSHCRPTMHTPDPKPHTQAHTYGMQAHERTNLQMRHTKSK